MAPVFKLIVLCLISALAGYALHWLGSSIADWRSDPNASGTEVRVSALVLTIALAALGSQLLPVVGFYGLAALLLLSLIGVWIVPARRARRRRPAPGWLHH